MMDPASSRTAVIKRRFSGEFKNVASMGRGGLDSFYYLVIVIRRRRSGYCLAIRPFKSLPVYYEAAFAAPRSSVRPSTRSEASARPVAARRLAVAAALAPPPRFELVGRVPRRDRRLRRRRALA